MFSKRMTSPALRTLSTQLKDLLSKDITTDPEAVSLLIAFSYSPLTSSLESGEWAKFTMAWIDSYTKCTISAKTSIPPHVKVDLLLTANFCYRMADEIECLAVEENA